MQPTAPCIHPVNTSTSASSTAAAGPAGHATSHTFLIKQQQHSIFSKGLHQIIKAHSFRMRPEGCNKWSYLGKDWQRSNVLHECSCGALMALRAGALRQVTGIVITASHNPEQDNGVKLVDPNGNMLDSQWEASLIPCYSLHQSHHSYGILRVPLCK